jgi:hypothetical protein
MWSRACVSVESVTERIPVVCVTGLQTSLTQGIISQEQEK